MSDEYRKIFGYKFEVLHNGVDRYKVRKVNLKIKLRLLLTLVQFLKMLN